jgi:hypothetical protein
VPWGQRHAVLRDEKLAGPLDAHTAQVTDAALRHAASAVLESTGEPGSGAAAAGRMMSESELQRIIDRAGLTATPADPHPLAYSVQPPAPSPILQRVYTASKPGRSRASRCPGSRSRSVEHL